MTILQNAYSMRCPVGNNDHLMKWLLEKIPVDEKKLGNITE
jgi:hypothetical protein